MRGVRIKLGADVVEKVVVLKAAEQSVPAYVRQLIEREFHELTQRRAAMAYMQFLQAKPEEQEAMDAWASGR